MIEWYYCIYNKRKCDCFLNLKHIHIFSIDKKKYFESSEKPLKFRILTQPRALRSPNYATVKLKAKRCCDVSGQKGLGRIHVPREKPNAPKKNTTHFCYLFIRSTTWQHGEAPETVKHDVRAKNSAASPIVQPCAVPDRCWDDPPQRRRDWRGRRRRAAPDKQLKSKEL